MQPANPQRAKAFFLVLVACFRAPLRHKMTASWLGALLLGKKLAPQRTCPGLGMSYAGITCAAVTCESWVHCQAQARHRTYRSQKSHRHPVITRLCDLLTLATAESAKCLRRPRSRRLRDPATHHQPLSTSLFGPGKRDHQAPA